ETVPDRAGQRRHDEGAGERHRDEDEGAAEFERLNLVDRRDEMNAEDEIGKHLPQTGRDDRDPADMHDGDEAAECESQLDGVDHDDDSLCTAGLSPIRARLACAGSKCSRGGPDRARTIASCTPMLQHDNCASIFLRFLIPPPPSRNSSSPRSSGPTNKKVVIARL